MLSEGEILLHISWEVFNSTQRTECFRCMVQRTKALELLSRVLLKVVPVLLHNKNRMIETFAILDDIAERTMLLPTAV